MWLLPWQLWLLSLGDHPVASSTCADGANCANSNEGIAKAFTVSLVRPDDVDRTADKIIFNASVVTLLTDEEREAVNRYDDIFEKYSLYCNGRWLGVQILQDAQDLMYLQHLVYKIRPRVIVETGTYKGGLTHYFASLFEITDNKEGFVMSIDRHHPDQVWDKNWFCPQCTDCQKPYETDLWERRVRFLQGRTDDVRVYNETLTIVERESEHGPVMVNLDASHEAEGAFLEIALYAPMVSVGSFLIVQDAKLDRLWEKPAVSSAVNRFLEILPGEFVVEQDLAFYAYSQHKYLRRVKHTIDYRHFT